MRCTWPVAGGALNTASAYLPVGTQYELHLYITKAVLAVC